MKKIKDLKEQLTHALSLQASAGEDSQDAWRETNMLKSELDRVKRSRDSLVADLDELHADLARCNDRVARLSSQLPGRS